ncbi:MAG: FAD-dependent oxidoreductase [Spirochaetes bacterium]|nr:FAD-dependent oxidoreductase [Spirochaetota bacterium]
MFEKSYDVAVCGGGIAGAAAAIASARQGKKTVFIEKTVMSGGLATTGLIYIYLPLCDGYGTQVLFGIAEELLLASLKYGPGNIPNWRIGKNAEEAKRYRIIFSPASFTLAIDELLVNAGVDIWYDTLICGAQVENGRLTAVEVENKSGRGRINAKCFVDATGDADVAHFAGLDCPTAQNALAFWVLEHAKGAKWRLEGSIESVSMHADGGSIDKKRGMSGIDGAEVTKFILDGRAKYLARLKKEYASGNQSRTTLFPLTLPSMAQFRTTRHIPALYKLRDGEDWKHFDDSIGMTADWRKSGFVWEIPYRSMVPVGLKNLVAAGRCTAAEEDAWEVTRVIPTAALTGEAAGTAAALCADKGISPDELPVTVLQDALRKAGNKIHLEDVGLAPKK